MHKNSKLTIKTSSEYRILYDWLMDRMCYQIITGLAVILLFWLIGLYSLANGWLDDIIISPNEDYISKKDILGMILLAVSFLASWQINNGIFYYLKQRGKKYAQATTLEVRFDSKKCSICMGSEKLFVPLHRINSVTCRDMPWEEKYFPKELKIIDINVAGKNARVSIIAVIDGNTVFENIMKVIEQSSTTCASFVYEDSFKNFVSMRGASKDNQEDCDHV